MKKPIIAATLIVCLVAWCVRYYKVNGGCRRKRKTQKNDTQNAKNSKKIGE